MDPFVRPCRFSRGDCSLKVYDSKIDCGAVKFLQRIAPDVIEWQWARYRAVGILCQSDVIARIAHIRFVQNGIHWMRRSEERRVGKECRSGWSPEHLKKKG